jgi:hypothetical protein
VNALPFGGNGQAFFPFHVKIAQALHFFGWPGLLVVRVPSRNIETEQEAFRPRKTDQIASCALRAPGQRSSPGHPNPYFNAE